MLYIYKQKYKTFYKKVIVIWLNIIVKSKYIKRSEERSVLGAERFCSTYTSSLMSLDIQTEVVVGLSIFLLFIFKRVEIWLNLL